MGTITLTAKKREEKGKKARIIAGNNIPAVMYGNDVMSQSLWVNATEFNRLFSSVGTNTVITLDVDNDKPVNVLIYDFQIDPITDNFSHIDFYVVNMKEEVEAEIPLVFTGVSPAVKELGGTLVKNNDTLVVKALPADLPHEIEVDITKLATFEDVITVADVTVGNKVSIILDDEAIIASVVAPRTEEEMAELDSEVDVDVSKVEGVADDEKNENDVNEKTQDEPKEK